MARVKQPKEHTILKYNGEDLIPNTYGPQDKDNNRLILRNYILDRILRFVKIGNLPKTIPEREFKLLLLKHGHGIITDKNTPGSFYFLVGEPGSKRDVYFTFSDYIVTNPWMQEVSDTYNLGEDCELIRSDSTMQGMLPLIDKYVYNITETELSLYIATILSRVPIVFLEDTDRGQSEVKVFIDKIITGEFDIAIANRSIEDIDAIKTQPAATTAAESITKLIELRQYQMASLYNEIGLNANWNAKRESLSSSEALLNDDGLKPLITDFFDNIKEGIERVNEHYGLNITVEWGQAWKDTQEKTTEDKKEETLEEQDPKVEDIEE